MGRPKNVQNQELAGKAERELRKIDEAGVCIRLMAIIQASRRSVDDVADEFNVSSRTIFRWINSFSERGLEGLRGSVRGHRQSKLSPLHKKVIANWVNNNVNSEGEPEDWTLEKLRRAIKEEFGIQISIMPLWLHLQKMGCKLRRSSS